MNGLQGLPFYLFAVLRSFLYLPTKNINFHSEEDGEQDEEYEES